MINQSAKKTAKETNRNRNRDRKMGGNWGYTSREGAGEADAERIPGIGFQLRRIIEASFARSSLVPAIGRGFSLIRCLRCEIVQFRYSRFGIGRSVNWVAGVGRFRHFRARYRLLFFATVSSIFRHNLDLSCAQLFFYQKLCLSLQFRFINLFHLEIWCQFFYL